MNGKAASCASLLDDLMTSLHSMENGPNLPEWKTAKVRFCDRTFHGYQMSFELLHQLHSRPFVRMEYGEQWRRSTQFNHSRLSGSFSIEKLANFSRSKTLLFTPGKAHTPVNQPVFHCISICVKCLWEDMRSECFDGRCNCCHAEDSFLLSFLFLLFSVLSFGILCVGIVAFTVISIVHCVRVAECVCACA